MEPISMAAILGGSALVGGLSSYFGSNQAADATRDAARMQADAQNHALAVQQSMYNQSRADMSPFMAMQRQAWEGYMKMLQNPDFAGLDAQGNLEHANTMAMMGKAGLRNSSANWAAQTLVGQQLALEKTKMRLGAFNPMLGLGAPSQQAALANSFGQNQAGLYSQGGAAQAGYTQQAGMIGAQGTMGIGQSIANPLNALGMYGIAQAKNAAPTGGGLPNGWLSSSSTSSFPNG